MNQKTALRRFLTKELLPIVLAVAIGTAIGLGVVPALIDGQGITERAYEGYGVLQDIVLSQGVRLLAD